MLSHSFLSIGRGTRISPPLRFRNLGRISLGSNVQIHSGCWIQAIASRANGKQAVISIGSNASIGMNATISGVHSIVIEDCVLLGRNVYISDHGHEFEDINTPIYLQGLRKVARVRIGYGAWLGQNVVVLPGVSIGRNSVVGANSVVNSDIADYSVAVGSPARIVKKYNGRFLRWDLVGKNERDY
ncbi:MAG: acyltransferase [Candidatus Kryptoniota bacterium]